MGKYIIPFRHLNMEISCNIILWFVVWSTVIYWTKCLVKVADMLCSTVKHISQTITIRTKMSEKPHSLINAVLTHKIKSW